MLKKIQLRLTAFFFSALLLLSFTGIQSASAQMGDTGDILRAGVADANILLQEYLRPLGSGFGADLNSGWVNSGRPYKTLGFDLRVNVAVSIVPTGDRAFNLNDFNFQNIERVGGATESQTAFGDNILGSEVGIFGNNPLTGQREEITRFTMPEGLGYPYVPAPMIQATVGVIKDTDISLRFTPSVEIDDFSLNLFGIGVRHGLNQWLPGGALLPVDLSVQAGYTKLTSGFGFDLQPDAGQDIYNPFSGTPALWDNQKIDFEATGFTGNLIVGKTLPIISVYGGLGFQTSSVTILSPGSYPITSFNPNFDPTSTTEETREKVIERLDDPINIAYDGANSIHALAGFRIRLAILTISGSYTLSNYSTANVGVGISFR